MDIQKELLLWVGAALVCAMVVSFIMCPLVKSFAYKIGAIDVPKDNRRMHKKPVPRLGGLAIFLGFIVSMLLFVKVDHQLQGILLGASIIVIAVALAAVTPVCAPPVSARMPSGLPVPSPVKKASSSAAPMRRANSRAM